MSSAQKIILISTIGILVIATFLIVFTYVIDTDEFDAYVYDDEMSLPIYEDIEVVTFDNVDRSQSFEERLSETPRASFQEVLDNVYLNSYSIYSCESPELENVLVLTARSSQDGVENHYRDAVTAIMNWEEYIFEDIGQFIFPDLRPQDQVGLLNFSGVPNTGQRRATVFIAGEERTIHYGWRLNYVLFASTEACLSRVKNAVYNP